MKLALACTAAFFAAVPLAGAEETLTAVHVAKLRTVTSAVIAPDGTRVAYTLSVPRIPFTDENGGSFAELHVAAPGGGGSRPFVTGKVNVGSVRFTPDGRGIAFVARRGDDKQAALYVIPVDGGEARRVAAHATAIGGYSFSPDGRQVAFLAADKEADEAKKLKEKGFDAEVYEEDLRFTRVFVAATGANSPDGPDGPDERPRQLDLEGNAMEVHWSPAGDRLAVTLSPTPLVDDEYMRKKVVLVNPADGAVLGEVATTGKLGAVAFSPDGRHLALIGSEDQHDPQEGRLLLASAQGGAAVDLLPGVEGHVTSAGWQDGATLLFLLDQGTMTSLERIGADGKGRATLVPKDKLVMKGLSVAQGGGAVAFTSDAPAHPDEAFHLKLDGGAPERLSASNPWLDAIRLAPQEVVRHRARDGLELDGILIRPLDEEPGRRYPLILTVHGGPEAHMQNGWLTRYSYPGQVAAARGFAVFYPNYRGSTGRGVAFSKLGQADYGGKEFDDLIDAVDHLVGSGLVDQDRVGITGGSYGGFATAWCATRHTERFAAGVMFVGISDQISKSGSTDIPNEMYLVHSRKRLWEDWQFFLERSPIYYVEQARTPLLIMHGKEDPRVHPSQSLELYRQLKVLGRTPVRLVHYPGEGHGNRKAAGRYDYNLRMMRWFEHYLQGDGGAPPPPELDYPLAPEKKAAGATEEAAKTRP